MKWSMPTYTLGGKIVLDHGRVQSPRALNFWRGQELGIEPRQVGAMGQFGKLTSLDDLPPEPISTALIREAAELARQRPAPRKPKHAPKPAPELHPEFAAALAKAPEGQSRARRLPAVSASATISNGSPKRSRTRRARSASPPRSNG